MDLATNWPPTIQVHQMAERVYCFGMMWLPYRGDCHGNSCAVWGSDNGNSLSDGTMHGQFAIYVSAEVSAPNFDCENATLALEISESATDFVETQGIRYVPFKSQYVLLVLIALLGIWFVRRQR